MNLARIDGNRVAGASLHHTATAVGFLRAAINHPYAKLLMRVTRKYVIGV